MLNYANLNDTEFEALCRDIMERKLGVPLRRFGPGKDGGVDLTNDADAKNIIVQVKHYRNSTTTQLVNSLKNEIKKVITLSPQQYHICCSRELSVENIRELYLHFNAYMASDKNIITMLLIFLAAGAFVGVVGRSSAESVAYFMLSVIPPRFAVAVLFIVACFVSTAMGTSVGTITLITPIAVSVATASGFSVPLCIGSVMGGAMFGDNLSFISDTTIAACNGQGCAMKDKFKENFGIALPAAIATLVIILVLSMNADINGVINESYNLIQIIPYVLVLIGGIAGINVFVVLLIGIFSGAIIMLATGQTVATALLANMGSGVSGMFETSMVAILVAAMCALIREYGGFEALLSAIRRIFKGKKGGQLGMGLLVGAMDIATANNTVAIVMANPIAKEISDEYGISNRKAASLLDTFSCIFQGAIPYGARCNFSSTRTRSERICIRHHAEPLLSTLPSRKFSPLHFCDSGETNKSFIICAKRHNFYINSKLHYLIWQLTDTCCIISVGYFF